MGRNLYIKSLWTSLVLAWACVIPLMGQTIPAVLNGEYKLTANTTINTTLTVGTTNAATIDLNGFVLTKSGGGFVFTVGENKTLTIIDSNPNRTNSGKYGLNKATVTINGGVITGGTGDRGGAGMVGVGSKLYLKGGTIAGCVSKAANNYDSTNEKEKFHIPTNGCGGAIFIQQGGYFEMDGGHIAYCQTQNTTGIAASPTGQDVGLGGAVFVDSEAGKDAEFVMKSGSIYNCVSGSGGAVYVHSPLDGVEGAKGAKFTMSGGKIYNCNAVYDMENITSNPFYDYGGGAVYVSPSATFTMTGGTLHNNRTASWGNAVYVKGIFNMTDGTIQDNRPYDWDGTTMPYPPSVKNGKGYGSVYGGGVFTYTNTAKFTMDGGTISGNYAASGGGVMVWSDSKFTMNGGTITENHAIGKGGLGNGGAVYVQAAIFDFNKGTLSKNTARRYGGAININQTAKLNLEGECIIDENVANHGGGISQEQGKCVMVLKSGNKIINNSAHGENTQDEDGNGNKEGNGGGLFIEKGELTIYEGVTISGNSATGKGGGVSLYVSRIVGDIKVEMLGGLVSNNTASGTGGGIDVYADRPYQTGTGEGGKDSPTDTDNGDNHLNDVDVNIQGGTFSDNQASVGGGVHIGVNTGNSVARMTVGTSASVPHINGNTATDSGGGFAMNNSGSTAANMGTVTIHNGELIGNTAVDGGGFFVKNGKVSITTCKISGNEASQYGGGLYVYNDTETSQNVTFSGGHFVSNTAAYGGGVALNGPINLTMQGDIENNLATNGGGLYLGSGGQMSFGQGLIRNNQATKNTTPMSNATAYQKGVTNVTGIGGGLFMDSNTSLVFTDEEQLGLYGNIADNGADDIFANGNGTSVVLPNVESMILTDFKVPTKSIYWVEDYITGDRGYDNGTKKATDGVVRRYRDALSQLKDIYKVSSAQYDNTYLCLALGYRLVFATIVKEGLKAGESAIFKVYPVGGNTDSTAPYASVLLTGTGSSESKSVRKRIALAEGTWRVEETNWSWNYTTSQDEAQKDGKFISESNSEKENTFTFTNSLNSTDIKYDEAIKVNTMGGTSTTAQ